MKLPFKPPAINKFLYKPAPNNIITISDRLSLLRCLVSQKYKFISPRFIVIVFLSKEIEELDGRILLWVFLALA